MSESADAGCIAGIDEVAELYLRHAVRVRRLVGLDVRGADLLIEDACQVAWMRLLRHRSRVQRAGAVRWVVRVARHEAYRQLGRSTRESSLEQLEAEGEREPAPDLIEDLVARRERLRAIDALPDRQRRLVWLQGLGFNYEEMAGATGDSRRTVERQLLRAHRTLTQREAAA